MATIEIPFPPSKLMPNRARGLHWAAKGVIARDYRAVCFAIALDSVKPASKDVRVPLSIVFHPPDKRGRDLDNMLAACKAGLDGIAEAWNYNDRLFLPITIDIGEPIRGGKVVIKY